jgi:hypothetical protein
MQRIVPGVLCMLLALARAVATTTTAGRTS